MCWVFCDQDQVFFFFQKRKRKKKGKQTGDADIRILFVIIHGGLTHLGLERVDTHAWDRFEMTKILEDDLSVIPNKMHQKKKVLTKKSGSGSKTKRRKRNGGEDGLAVLEIFTAVQVLHVAGRCVQTVIRSVVLHVVIVRQFCDHQREGKRRESQQKYFWKE